MFDLRPLRSAAFRHLAAALWVNEIGNSIGEVALAVLVYDRTGSPLASATLFLALRFLPAMLAPLLTTFVEARPARMVLAAIFMLESGVFAGIAVVAHHFSLPVVLVLVAVDGVLAIVASSLARSATTNDLVSRGLLREGNGLANLGTMVAFAAGPVVAGAIIASHGASTALTIDAATFLGAALVVISAPKLHVETDRDGGTIGRVKAGATALAGRPAVRRLLIATSITFGLSSIAVPIEVVFAQTTLHAGSQGYGLLLTSWGVGMIAGGTVFAVARDTHLMRLLGFSTALVAVGYGGLAASPTLAVACAFSWLGGTGNGAAWVAAMTAIQERIPMSAQSLTMSVLYGLNQVMPAVGFVVGGVVTALGSPRLAYAVAAIGTGLAIATFAIRPIDQIPLIQPDEQPSDSTLDGRASGAADVASEEMLLMRRTRDTPPITIG